MANDWEAPTSISMMVHEPGEISSRTNGAVPGALHISASTDGYETFDLVLFTDNEALASDIAAAIRAVVAKHKAAAEARVEQAA